VFRQVYNDEVNLMTPVIRGYGQRGELVWELSQGDNILGDGQLYGVTVIELPNTKRPDLSQCFNTHAKANDYIKRGFK
jgi:hypothetical protein